MFTASTTDPGGFTWRVVAQPAIGPSHRWLWIGIGLIVVSIALAALAVFLGNRRADREAGLPDRPAPGGTPSVPDPTPVAVGAAPAAGHSGTAGHSADDPADVHAGDLAGRSDR